MTFRGTTVEVPVENDHYVWLVERVPIEAIAAVHVQTWHSAYRGTARDAYVDTSVERRSEVWSRILARLTFLVPVPSSSKMGSR